MKFHWNIGKGLKTLVVLSLFFTPFLSRGQMIINAGKLNIGDTANMLSVYARLNSPSFIGSPTVPSWSAKDSSNKAANTKYVDAAVAATVAPLTTDFVAVGNVSNKISGTSNFTYNTSYGLGLAGILGLKVFNSSIFATTRANIPSADVGGTTMIGVGSGIPTMSGIANSGFGGLVLKTLTSGFANSAFGWSAGKVLTSGSFDVFVGTQSGLAATTGLYNTGVGYSSLTSITTGSDNIQIGSVKTSIGQTIQSTSSKNILIGNDSLAVGVITTNATFVGHGYTSLRNNVANFGQSNQVIALGNQGMTTAAYNALGITATIGDIYFNQDSAAYLMYNSLSWIKWGGSGGGGGGGPVSLPNQRVPFGSSGNLLTSDPGLTFGKNTQVWQLTFNNWIFGLDTAGGNVYLSTQPNTSGGAFAGGNNTLIGKGTGFGVTSGSDNTAFGSGALNSVTGGIGNIAVGRSVFSQITTVGSSYNIGIGYFAGSNIGNSSAHDILIGTRTGRTTISGNPLNNVILLGDSITSDRDNVAIFAAPDQVVQLTNGGGNTAKMNAISTPVASDIYYNTDSSAYLMHNGSVWVKLGAITSTQVQTVSGGATTFTFTSVPANMNDYLIYVNGIALIPTTDYTTSGNIVTILGVRNGDVIRYQRLR